MLFPYSSVLYPCLLVWSRLLVLRTSRGLSGSTSACRTCSGHVPDPLWGAPDPLWAPRTSKAHARVQAYLVAPCPGRKGQENCTLLMRSKVCASSSLCVQETGKQMRAVSRVPGAPRQIPGRWTPEVVPGSTTWHNPEGRKAEERTKFSEILALSRVFLSSQVQVLGQVPSFPLRCWCVERMP